MLLSATHNSPSHALKTLDFQWNMSSFDSRNPRTDGGIFKNLIGGWIEARAKLRGREDKARGDPALLFGEGGGGRRRVGVGAVLWKLRTSHLHVPPIIPLARLVSSCTGLFGPLERSCLPLLPPSPPMSPTRADHKRCQNNPNYGPNIILVSFGIVLVSLASFWYHRPPRLFFGPHPQYGWDFPEEIPEKFRKDPGNALRAFPGIPLESTAGMPQTL